MEVEVSYNINNHSDFIIQFKKLRNETHADLTPKKHDQRLTMDYETHGGAGGRGGKGKI